MQQNLRDGHALRPSGKILNRTIRAAQFGDLANPTHRKSETRPNVQAFVQQFSALRSVRLEETRPTLRSARLMRFSVCVRTTPGGARISSYAPDAIVSLMFDQLGEDVSVQALHLAAAAGLSELHRIALMQIIARSSIQTVDVEFAIHWITQHLQPPRST